MTMRHEKHYIGIDIGGTNTKIALISQNGNITNLHRIVNDEIKLSRDNFLKLVLSNIKGISNSSSLPIIGIGISSPGLQTESGRGTLFSINMPILNKVDLYDFFTKNTGLPVVVHNDLVAHGLAESHFGSGKNVERFLSVSLGTGIGHTFFLHGHPQFSLCGVSGDSGRMILDYYSTDRDSMNASGTAEALCGVRAIETLASTKYPSEACMSAHEVIAAARCGADSIAVEIMSEIARRVAILLVNLSTVYFPQVISLTGGQTEAGDSFLDACRKEYSKMSLGFFDNLQELTGSGEKVRILKSRTGGLTGLLGSIVPLLEGIE